MNPNHIEKLFNGATKVNLDEKKKDAIHQDVLLFMKRNPLQKSITKREFFGIQSYLVKFKTASIALAAVMVCVLVGTVAAVNAESALPGDFLYPMKLGFNEKIKEALAVTDDAKITVQVVLAEQRLKEAETLMVQGKINSSNEAQINANFTAHAKAALQDINSLHAPQFYQKAEIVNADFEASLRAHEHILNDLKKDNQHDVIDPLVFEVAATTKKAFDDRTDLNAHMFNSLGANSPTKDTTTVQQKISAVEHSVATIKKLINSDKNSMGSDAALQSQDNLQLVQKKIDEAKSELSNHNDYAASISSLQEAGIIAQESKDLINAKTNLGAKVSIGIDKKDETGADGTVQSINDKATTDTKIQSMLPVSH
jgi:hypothetical protein